MVIFAQSFKFNNMAVKLTNKLNTIGANSEYPFGSIRDESSAGANDGTPINRNVYSDAHQFFEKLMYENQVTHNNLPDNSVNGYQLYEAIKRDIVKRNIGIGTEEGSKFPFTGTRFSLLNQKVTIPAEGVKRMVTVTQKAQCRRDTTNTNGSGIKMEMKVLNNTQTFYVDESFVDIQAFQRGEFILTTIGIFVHDGTFPLEVDMLFTTTTDAWEVKKARTTLLAVPIS